MPSGGPGSHRCPHCGKSCRSEPGLGVHIARAHPDKWVPKGPKARRRRGLVPAVVAPQVIVPEPQPEPHAPGVNYCPRCGAHIALINHVLTVVEGVSNGGR